MSNYPIYHGLTLADGATIENFHVERLLADPVPVDAGRMWYNVPEKAFKVSSLDSSGAVVIRTFATLEELNAAIASLTAAYEAAILVEKTRAEAAEAQVLVDAKDYTDVKDAAQKVYIDQQVAALVGGAPGTLDTLKELADALRTNPDVLTAIESTINSRIDGVVASVTAEETARIAAVSDLQGQLDAAEVSIQAAIDAEASTRASADTALDGRLSTVEGQVNGKIGNLSNLTTTEKGSLVGAINEVSDNLNAEIAARTQQAEQGLTGMITAEQSRATNAETALGLRIDTEIADRQAAITALETSTTQAVTDLTAAIGAEATRAAGAELAIRTDYNAKRYTYASVSPLQTYTINHNLGSDFVSYSLMVERPDGSWRNDVAGIQAVSNNQMKVYLSQALNIRLVLVDESSI